MTLPWKAFFKMYILDILLCSLLVAAFAAVSFYKLGDTNFPRTEYAAKNGKNERVTIDFGQQVELEHVVYMYGGELYTGFRLYSWDGGSGLVLLREEANNERFQWVGYPFQAFTRYVVIEPTATGVTILEMEFYDSEGVVRPVSYSEGAELIFDEPHLVPKTNPSFFNDYILDEALYAATAYDYIHGFLPFEWTHPPLSKSIIALGIDLFGMTPFGWRFMPALFGILMVIPVFALGKRMLGSRWLAFIAAFAFTFDFMHFVQARIATPDTFLVTFITCMFLFMYEYIRCTQKEPEKRFSPKSLVYFGLSGLFMGLAIAVKWSAVFAGLGLLVLFVLAWLDSKAHYANRGNEGLLLKDISNTMIYGVLFFIIVPAVIYFISYIPFARGTGLPWPGCVIEVQADMLNFHMHSAEETAFQSNWWTWPLNMHPIDYNRYAMGEGGHTGVHAFGNPALWWGGLLAFIWCIKRWIADKDRTARFLCVAWIAQILPWALISRPSYIYHYFPCVPFLALMAAYFIKTRYEKRQVWYALSFCVLLLTLFVMFYPMLSGVFAVDRDYATWLEWLPGWNFIG